MSTEPTIEMMNATIAIFMGYEQYQDRSGTWFKKEGLITCMHPRLEDLSYHKSWDKLMEVVEKIETPELDNDRVTRSAADVKIYYRACKIRYEPDEDSGDRNDETMIQAQGETKLEAVYKAVYQFITWYNQQKNK